MLFFPRLILLDWDDDRVRTIFNNWDTCYFQFQKIKFKPFRGEDKSLRRALFRENGWLITSGREEVLPDLRESGGCSLQPAPIHSLCKTVIRKLKDADQILSKPIPSKLWDEVCFQQELLTAKKESLKVRLLKELRSLGNLHSSMAACDELNGRLYAAHRITLKKGVRCLRAKGVRHLYHLTHKNNISSILNNGILSREMLLEIEREFKDISDWGIQRKRNDLHGFVPLFFMPKNPMAYYLISGIGYSRDNLYFVPVDLDALTIGGALCSSRNAAVSGCTPKEFPLSLQSFDWKTIFGPDRHRSTFQEKYEYDQWKEIRMAECLIPDKVKPEYLGTPIPFRKFNYQALEA